MLYSFYDSPEGGVSRGESERHLAATRCRFAPIERLPRPSEVGILSESRVRPFPFSRYQREQGGKPEMRTYYRGPDAVITDTHFVWQSSSVRIFAIDDLDDVRLERTVAAGPSGVEFSLGLGLLILAIAAGLKLGVLAALPLVAALVAVVLIALRRRGGHAWEIRARYRAQDVTLYTSPDPRTFNQVTRALRRTIERRGLRQSYGLVAG